MVEVVQHRVYIVPRQVPVSQQKLCGIKSCLLYRTGERKWVERNGSNRPPVPWVESSPFRNWVEWTWVDLGKSQVQGRQHIDFDPSPFGFRTFRHKTFRQQDGGRRFGNFLLPKRLWCRNVFTAGERRFGNKFSVLSPSSSSSRRLNSKIMEL